MAIERVGVLGCGLMGHGITQICAQAGWDVVVREIDEGQLERGMGRIEKQLARSVEKERISQEDADAVRARISPTLEYSDLAGSDLVIEAITEDLELKLEMWGVVDSVVDGAEAVFATNTSSLAVVDQAVATSRPERFLGMHFFNPAQVMPLLEVVQTVTTGPEALATGFDVGEKLEKTCVHARDKTGFIVNRLLVPYMLDAIRAYEEGVGEIGQIDIAMKAGANHPMGPLALADFVGLDTLAAIGDVMFDEYRERRFAVPPTLRRMVTAGLHGRKSGKGFYDYSSDKPVPADLGL
jgi:3-hydroxybutyryl-CoA dehydrogenase